MAPNPARLNPITRMHDHGRVAMARSFVPFHWREALLCAPAMPLLVLAGVLTGEAVAGVTAAGAAFAVGFGAARELRGRRWGAMAAATLGMSLSAFAGSLAGLDPALFTVIAAGAGALCAAAALYDENLWWVALQVVIAFFVAGYYAGNAETAEARALAVLAGGLAQMGIVRVLAWSFPAASAPTILPARPSAPRMLRLAHMGRAAVCVAASLLVARRLAISNSYWAPMTALLVLKPRLHETRARGIARLTGTLAGCLAATLYAHLCRDWTGLLGVGMAVSALLSYALQRAHYASLTAAITATVVLLLTLGHSVALANAEHRLEATLLGGGIALAVAALVPHGGRAGRPAVDRIGS